MPPRCSLVLGKTELAVSRSQGSNGWAANAGNFLELVKLIAKYDPVMREHLASVRLSAKPTTLYLSPEIQNEVIALMAKHVRREIPGSQSCEVLCSAVRQYS